MPYQFTSLHKLEEKIKTGSAKYHFGIGVEIEKIETIEKAYGLVFPVAYKQFLQHFNGGMITEYDGSFYTDMTEWEPDGPKESSYYFYSLDELVDSYRSMRLDDDLIEDDFQGIYPIIPICKTPGNGQLFLLSQRGLNQESPVFGNFGLDHLEDCEQISADFDHYLNLYLQYDGFPPIKLNSNKNLCKKFLEENAILTIAREKESNKQVIERNTALLKLYPKDGMNYIERGNALLHQGQRKLALEDYNKALELEPDEAFNYYCRGSLILEYGSARKALIDMDTAVQLEPKDALYLAGRADAFYKLGRLEEALKDCNTILNEIDGVNTIALLTRVQLYRDLGEHDKADKDSALLDDIYT